MKNLEELLMHELKDMYDAEHQLVAALTKMEEAATANTLKKAFDAHREQTNIHIERLNEVFALLDAKPERETCHGMKGLIKESEKILNDDMDDDVRNAALIASAQRAEHYEMAGYGTMRTYARMLGHKKAADILQETLDEEGSTDEKLTDLAQKINRSAKN